MKQLVEQTNGAEKNIRRVFAMNTKLHAIALIYDFLCSVQILLFC